MEALLGSADDLPRELRARALLTLGGALAIHGEFERGRRLHEECLAEFRALGDELAVAHLLHRLAVEASRTGDAERAHGLTEESLALHQKVGSPSGEAMALGMLANLAYGDGRVAEALELAHRSVAAAAEVGWAWWQIHYRYQACEYALDLGRIEEAEEEGRQGLRLAQSIGYRQLIVYLLALLARAASVRGKPERAGVLWGAIEVEEGRGPVGQWEGEREAYAANVDFEPPAFERGRLRGRGLPLAEAVEYALSLD